jgi:hypothetical protein
MRGRMRARMHSPRFPPPPPPQTYGSRDRSARHPRGVWRAPGGRWGGVGVGVGFPEASSSAALLLMPLL